MLGGGGHNPDAVDRGTDAVVSEGGIATALVNSEVNAAAVAVALQLLPLPLPTAPLFIVFHC